MEYECININILFGNVVNIYLIITKGNDGDIDDDNTSFRGYYNIIIFSSCKYTLQADLNIDGQVISSGEMVCEGAYYLPMNIRYRYNFFQKINQIETFYLRGKLSLVMLTLNVMIIMMLFRLIVNFFHRMISVQSHLSVTQQNNMII